MTSPRQRKKRAVFLARKKVVELSTETKIEQKEQPVVAAPPPSVVESVVKLKKPVSKNGLVETKPLEPSNVTKEQKPQDQVVEQSKEEVKTSTGE
jgi:hypothetical protein